MAVHLTALCYFVKNAQLAPLLFITIEYEHTYYQQTEGETNL